MSDVTEKMLNLGFSLRLATMEDYYMLFSWRNDPDTRKNSHNTDYVFPEEHRKWLQSTLENPNRTLLIAKCDGATIGTIRLDHPNGIEAETEISWTVSPEQRGNGYGKRMVRFVARQLTCPIKAEVKETNTASQKVAEYAGMKLVGQTDGILQYFRDSLI